MANISIIIPTYNERDNVVLLIEQIVKLLPNSKILIVDDNSPDGTAEVLRNLKIPNLTVFVRNERGLGSALRYGIKKALELETEFIVTMDADLSHDPIYLPQMTKIAIEGKYDLVIGSRYINGGGIENWPLSRRIISRGANYLFRLISHSPLNDNTSNYRVYSRKAALLALDCETANGYEFQICSIFKIIKSNLKVIEYPIIFKNRKLGKSKLRISEILNWFLYIIKLSLSS
ncbi:MAG: polyprenol monophosphomannose synthase [Saccharolobus sp.]|jgi:dolichol-phosphate mannosyltransferase|uniref:polyprenol monophosphomannose synthase n=1 Tax=Saccharolobus sp. TaxID=2100761 RepID=UPI0028CC254C|nr:polyprenol monophosphomannose synthase [Saccharolobus sp.]MDT7860934.1 polyprenol monophosphomannose synthase [Saccharolobus sp.]